MQDHADAPPSPPVEGIPTDLISTNEASRLVPGHRRKAIHIATICRWVETGRIRGWKVAGRLLVSRADIMALFQEVQPKKAPRTGETARQRMSRAAQDRRTNEILKRNGLL